MVYIRVPYNVLNVDSFTVDMNALYFQTTSTLIRIIIEYSSIELRLNSNMAKLRS